MLAIGKEVDFTVQAVEAHKYPIHGILVVHAMSLEVPPHPVQKLGCSLKDYDSRGRGFALQPACLPADFLQNSDTV